MLDKELNNAVKELVDERYPSGWCSSRSCRRWDDLYECGTGSDQ